MLEGGGLGNGTKSSTRIVYFFREESLRPHSASIISQTKTNRAIGSRNRGVLPSSLLSVCIYVCISRSPAPAVTFCSLRRLVVVHVADGASPCHPVPGFSVHPCCPHACQMLRTSLPDRELSSCCKVTVCGQCVCSCKISGASDICNIVCVCVCVCVCGAFLN